MRDVVMVLKLKLGLSHPSRYSVNGRVSDADTILRLLVSHVKFVIHLSANS